MNQRAVIHPVLFHEGFPIVHSLMSFDLNESDSGLVEIFSWVRYLLVCNKELFHVLVWERDD